MQQNKDVYMPHRPLNQTRAFQQEIKFLKDKYGFVEYEKIGGLWKVVK
jgi:hypothetical protein